MKSSNKELLLNLFIGSPILTIIWAFIAMRMEDHSLISYGPFFSAILAVLVLYPYHLCISITHYLFVLWIKNRTLRLVVFQMLGLIAAGSLSYYLKSGWVAVPVYSSFIVFSVISFVGSKRRDS